MTRWTARPGRRSVLAIVFTAATIYACQETVITGPSGGGAPPPTTSVPPGDIRPPRVDAPFQFEGNTGFTLFAGARATEDQIRSIYTRAQSRLGPRAYARVCAEVQSWPGGARPWLPRGVSAKPFTSAAPAYIQLERFLDTTARIHGAQVLVVPICNLKEDGTSPKNREKWVKSIAALANEYEHTALEVVNEWRHPNSSISEGEMGNLLRAARREFDGLIGTDDNAHPGDLTYNPSLRGLVDFPSFHPWRNPDPTQRDFRKFADINGDYVLSETTGYDGQFGRLGGCCTDDRNQIIRYFQGCQAVAECNYVYHCVGCLGWPETTITWFPEAP